MGRLIDADALIEVIKESRPLNWTDSESELQEDADYNHFIEMVKEQPTAYDVEKVVAELEREKELHKEHYNISIYKDFPDVKQRYKQIQLVLDKAIEIVKRGGVNG